MIYFQNIQIRSLKHVIGNRSNSTIIKVLDILNEKYRQASESNQETPGKLCAECNKSPLGNGCKILDARSLNAP